MLPFVNYPDCGEQDKKDNPPNFFVLLDEVEVGK